MTTGAIHSQPTSRTASTNANTIGIVSSLCRRCGSGSAGNRYGWHENSPWPTAASRTTDAPPTPSVAAVETLLVEPLATSRSTLREADLSPYTARAGEFGKPYSIDDDAQSFGAVTHGRSLFHHQGEIAADTFSSGYNPHSLISRSVESGTAFGFEQSIRADQNHLSISSNSSASDSNMAMLFPWTYYFSNQFPALFRHKAPVPTLDPIDDVLTDEVWPYTVYKNATELYNELGSGEAIDNETSISAITGDFGAWELNFYMHGVIMPIIAIFGVLANLASFVVLTRHAMRSSVINIYLAALSAFDGLLLLIALLLYPPMSYCEWYGSDATSSWCRYFFYSSLITYPTSLIVQTGSVYTLVAITIDRFIAITWPLASRKWMTNRRALLVVAATVIWSIIYNIPAFLELKLTQQPVEYDEEDQPVTFVTLLDRTDMRKNSSYVRAYKGYCYLIFMLLLPAGTMIALNAYVTISVRRASRERRQSMNVSNSGREDKERRCTMMAILVVGTFLILNSLAFVNNMLEGFRTEDELTTTNFLTLVCFGNVLVALNSATNFFIYCALGLRFRQMFCKLFCPWCYTPEREYQYLSVYYGSGRNYCWTNGGGNRETTEPSSALLGGGIISMRTLSTKAPRGAKPAVRSNISAPTMVTNRTPTTAGAQRNVTSLAPAGTRISPPVGATNVRLYQGQHSSPNVVRFDVSQRN